MTIAALRTRRAGIVGLCLLAALAGGACTREADIVDEPDAILAPKRPTPEAGDIPTLDSGLGTDAFPACADRPLALCQGPVDFPCAFRSWVDSVAARCQQATKCSTNGWLRVKLDAVGCVESIGMDQPNDPIVSCLLKEFVASRCPCTNIEATYFLGLANKPDSGCVGGPKGVTRGD